MITDNSNLLSFKPSTFYFRRRLRTAPTRERAIQVGLTIIAERQRLRDWAVEEELRLPPQHKSSLVFTRELWATKDLEAAVDVSLRVVSDHEALRAWVRAQGFVPPKWIVDPDEATEKGWNSACDHQAQA